MKFTKWSQDFSVERVIPHLEAQHNLYMEHLARYRFCLKWIREERILDAGCGCGYGTKLMADAGAIKVIGIDNNQVAIDYCKKYYKGKNIQFIQGDCERFFFKNSDFNVVIAFEAIEHFQHPEKFLQETFRILTKPGILIISTPNNSYHSKPKNKFHRQEYNAKSFRILLKKYFTKVELYGQRYTEEVIEKNNSRAKKLDRLSRLIRKFIPKFYKDLLYSLFINKYLLNLQSERDFLIVKNSFNKAINLLGVCYK